jgi:hypothetical protein
MRYYKYSPVNIKNYVNDTSLIQKIAFALKNRGDVAGEGAGARLNS